MRVPKEEADLVGDLHYSWRKLRKLAAEVADNLATVQVGAPRGQGSECTLALAACKPARRLWPAARCLPPRAPIAPAAAGVGGLPGLCPHAPPHLSPLHLSLQVGFKRALLQDVKLFVVDAVAFRQDWEASGPTVPGLSPTDAADRLRKYQQLFEVRRRKWDSYAAGEQLFGLPVTLYPELERTQQEIAMLDRLYRCVVCVWWKGWWRWWWWWVVCVGGGWGGWGGACGGQ